MNEWVNGFTENDRGDFLVSLPLNGRNYLQLVRLSPNVSAEMGSGGQALALAGQQKFKEAESGFRAAVRLSPRLAPANVNLANLMAMRGDVAGAIDHYRLAIRTDDTYVPAHLNLATALLSQNNPREARPHLEKVLTFDPRHAEANLNLGVLLGVEGETESARRHLGQADKSTSEAVRQAAEAALSELNK